MHPDLKLDRYGRLTVVRGDPGLRIGSFIGRVARAAVSLTPIGSAVTQLLPTTASQDAKGPGRPRGRPEPGITGAVHRLVPGGHTGYIGGRRMNYANGKAARRAIRRIKGVRNMLLSIERQLPHKKCNRPHLKARR